MVPVYCKKDARQTKSPSLAVRMDRVNRDRHLHNDLSCVYGTIYTWYKLCYKLY